MDKIFKRAVSILVALVMTIVMIPANAFVSFADGGGNLKSSKAAANATENLTATGEITDFKYQKVNSIDTQSDYLIVYENGGTSVALNNKGKSSDNGTSVTITGTGDGYYNITNVDSSMLWSFNKTVTSGNIMKQVKITNKASNQNLSLAFDGIDIGESDTTLTVANIGNKFSLYNKGSLIGRYYYLDYNSKFKVSNNGKQIPSYGNLTIYKQISQQTKKVTYTLTKPTKLTYEVGESQDLSGGKITVKDESGKTIKTVDLSDENVQVTGFNSSAAGTQEITVIYEGKTFNYDITVTNPTVTPVDPIDDGIEYPNQGSVRVTKEVTDDTEKNFENTGLARLELGVTGVPTKKGVDAVLVFDISYSMNTNVPGTSKTRAKVAKEAAIKFIEKVLENNADGSASNNRVAIVTFNSKAKTLVGLSNKKDELKRTINNISDEVDSGDTNYDAGVEEAYKNLNEIRRKESNYNREQAVLFLSDGAPQNGYNDNNKPTSSDGYNHDATYDELEKAGAFLTKHKYSTQVKNLPATMYTVGFGLKDMGKTDKWGNITNMYFSKVQMEKILRDYMATSSDTFYSVQSADALTSAFEKIGTAIKKAGTQAVVTDTMGKAFNLQRGKQYPSGVKTDVAFPTTFDTTIKVTSYKLDSEGNRTSEKTDIETVTFSDDGSTATSDKLPDKSNIIENNKIKAKNFTYDLDSETFTWDIGDITEDEIVLSYPIYLENSMEGTREAGSYLTNESAILNYKNVNDVKAYKEFRKPQLPWKSANVDIEYYLVNQEGKPINSAGTVITYPHRVTLSTETRPLAKGSDLYIKADEKIPSGYTLHNKDAFYKIDKVGRENAVRTYSDSDISTKVTGKSPYTTSSVAFGVMTTTDLTPDTIVLDYGKPVTFNVLENDGLKKTTNITLTGVSKQEGTTLDVALNTGVSTSHNNKFVNEAAEDYGKLVKKSAKGDVTYTLSKYMDGIDKFYYEVTGKTTGQDEKEEDFYKYSSISVIPATSIYYEDNFSYDSEGNHTGGIYFDPELNVEVAQQSSDEQSSDNDKYGYDSSYDGDATDSDGSATEIKGNGVNVAKFTFKGTGFDLVGRTSTDSGAIIVKVYKGTDVDNNNIIGSDILYTEYQSGTLYQIPVYTYDCQKYGEYTVTIKVQNGKDFFLDAVRIYNPMNLNPEEDGLDESELKEAKEDAEKAQKAYNEAGESSPDIQEIRNLILANGEFKENNTGAVYVDGKNLVIGKDDSSEEIKDKLDIYKNEGPNNEVYLKQNQSIGFKLENLNNIATIQVGAKAPDGVATMVAGSGAGNDLTKKLNTATDMYYTLYKDADKDKISHITIANNSAYVVITNTTGNILSLTNVKVTYKNGVQTQALFMADSDVLSYTKKVAKARMKVEEPKLDLSISKAEFTSSSVKVNKDATVKVYTTKDVDSILIKDSKGNKVTPKSITSETKDVVNGKTVKVFEITIIPNKVGTQTYSFAAVGKDGSISDNTVNASINVKKQTILDKISSWFGF